MNAKSAFFLKRTRVFGILDFYGGLWPLESEWRAFERQT
jgi:hypothetical protein